MQESEIIKSAASSGASALSGVVVKAAAEKFFYPEKYGAGSIKRLNALKTAYGESYLDIPLPDTWSLSQENSPYQMLPEGTNWEQYLSTRMRSRKTTDLTVSVKKALKVISDFLDERRLNIGIIHDIHKGDIEELFFGEMSIWLTDTLNSNLDEKLGEKIDKRRQYLDRVFDSDEIFKNQFVHDKSSSRNIIKKINSILKKSLTETQRFTLNKFQDITRETRDLHYDFLTAFSYFSEKLKDVVDLEDPESLHAFKETGGRYTKLFVLFGEKAASHDESDFENFDPVKEFRLLMGDRTKKMDIWADLGKEMTEEISDIFAAAYNMLVVMKLIKLASTVISTQGTTELFCNKEGKDYFLFLLKDFGSELDNLMLKLTLFNEKYHAYSQAEVLNAKKNPSKEKPIGQYVRFGNVFKSMKGHEENLQAFLRSATEGIEKFDGETPEKSWRKKEELYRALRERMRQKGAAEMAEKLERKGRNKHLYKEDVADEKEALPADMVVPNGIELQPRHDKLPRNSGEEPEQGIPATVVEEEKRVPGGAAAQNRQSANLANLPNPEGASSGAEAYQKLVVEQTAFLRGKIKESLEKLLKYNDLLFDRLFFRSYESVRESAGLRKILESGNCGLPESAVPPVELPSFYEELASFIEQIQDENAAHTYKLKNNIAKEIYFIARDLKEIFDKKKYRHLFCTEVGQAKKNVKLAIALQESVRLLELQSKLLVNFRDHRNAAEHQIGELRNEVHVQAVKVEEKEQELKHTVDTYSQEIGRMHEQYESKSEELKLSLAAIDAQKEELGFLRGEVSDLREDLRKKGDDLVEQSSKSCALDKKVADQAKDLADLREMVLQLCHERRRSVPPSESESEPEPEPEPDRQIPSAGGFRAA